MHETIILFWWGPVGQQWPGEIFKSVKNMFNGVNMSLTHSDQTIGRYWPHKILKQYDCTSSTIELSMLY